MNDRRGEVTAAEAIVSAVVPDLPHAFVLQGARGGLCALYFGPSKDVKASGDLLVVPPFAEEMNRCRAMVSLLARALGKLGVGTLILDPYGTGDSAGEFVDATWTQWRDDLKRGIAWLNEHGQGCRGLLGLRLGAAMATELVRDCPGITNLLLWQPVLSGKSFFTQFLRIRLAAEMELPDRIRSTAQLREMALSGEAIEVSGYEVGPALANELDGVVFDAASCAGRVSIDWLEVRGEDAPALAAASQKAVEDLRTRGASIDADAVVGPAFWQVHERLLAPNLIDATIKRVRGWSSVPIASDGLSAQQSQSVASSELPLFLTCGGDRLSACLHDGAPGMTRGVVIVVAGGPQYRVGAHRQFVSLARKLAQGGHSVLRFDLRGMGDSSGNYLGFEGSMPDIRAAVDELMTRVQSLREVVLIGECESASGILLYAWQDPRISGAIIINPWVRTPEGQAQVILKRYYLYRLRSPEFWRKVRSGKFDFGQSGFSLVRVLHSYWRGKRMFARSARGDAAADLDNLPLPDKIATGLSRFKGRVLLLMSGNDYIAREFDEVTSASRAWTGLLSSARITRKYISEADHTFSKRVWKESASDAIVEWIKD